MARSAIPLDTIWPNGSDPKTLVCVRAQCSVADLFNSVFGEKDLQELLHKQRGDTDLSQTPWYGSREELPDQLYTWQVTQPPNKPTDTLRHRKVRFESPPTALASKPFQNEESQVITELYPDKLYIVEAVSSTSAPYGDKFNVFFRYIFRADDDDDGPSARSSATTTTTTTSALHVTFHVEWLPAMNRMMRPVVGKAVDAGVRGTFKIFRSLLGTLQPTTDIKESELPTVGPPAVVSYEPFAEMAAGGEAVVRPGVLEHIPAHVHVQAPVAGFAPGLGPRLDLLSVMTQQLVYKDQVVLLADLLGAGLRSVSASDLGAQVLAAALTVWLITLLVAGLRAWKALCGDGGGGLFWPVRLAVCWPLALVDLPDSTAEVLTSLALVAAINWAVIRGTETLVRYLGKKHPGLLAAAAAASGGGGPHGGSGGREVIGGVPFSQTPVLGTRASSGGGAAGVGGLGRASSGGAGATGSLNHLQSASAAGGRSTAAARAAVSATSSAHAASAGAAAAPAGKDKGKGGFTGGTSFFAAAMGAAAGKAMGAASGGGGGGAAAAANPKPMRAAPAPKQFTPAQLRQLELGQVTSSKKASAASSPPAAVVAAPMSTAVPAAAAMADAWAADLPAGMVAPSGASASRLPSPPPRAASPQPPSRCSPPSRSASPPPKIVTGDPLHKSSSVAEAAATSSAAATGDRTAAAAEPASVKPCAAPGGGGGMGPPAATPAASPPPAAARFVAPPPSQPPPLAPPAQPAAGSTASPSAAVPSGLTTSSTFANMFSREGMDLMAESLRSAFGWDAPKPADPTAGVGSPDLTTSSAGIMVQPNQSHQQQHQQQLTRMKARSEVGGAFASDASASAAAAAPPAAVAAAACRGSTGAAAAGPLPGLRSLPQSFTVGAASQFSVPSDTPLLGYGDLVDEYDGGDDEGYDGELEPAMVVEEVFENERFQPFRGWGHMWPGHFLPSDRVGHWSDRQGKPGGSASMVFEQVVPQLPRGWRWLEEVWQVDLDGLDVEAVDNDGWSYALDFYLLKYPPSAQAGKCSLKHFVRRRRYFRTRVRIDGRSTTRSTRSARSSGAGASYYRGGLSTRVSEDGADGADTDGKAPVTSDLAAVAASAADSLEVQDRLLSLSEGFLTAQETCGKSPLEHIASPPGRGGGGGGGSGAPAVAMVEPRPPSASASPAVDCTAYAGDSGGGGDLSRPHSAAEGLSGILLQQQQQVERRWCGGLSSSGGAVAAPQQPPPAVQAALDLLTAGTAAGSEAGTGAGMTGSGAAADGSIREDVRQGGGDGNGNVVVQHSDLYVLSPKTEIMSHDPLGALAAKESRWSDLGREPPPPPPPPPDLLAAAVTKAADLASAPGGFLGCAGGGGGGSAAVGGYDVLSRDGGVSPSPRSSQRPETVVSADTAVHPATAVAATDSASANAAAAAGSAPAVTPTEADARVAASEVPLPAAASLAALPATGPFMTAAPVADGGGDDGGGGGTVAAAGLARRESLRTGRTARIVPQPQAAATATAEPTDGMPTAVIGEVAEGPIIAAELIE